MRKTWPCLLMISLLFLSACQGSEGAGEPTAEEMARQLRGEYLAASGCGGTVQVVADYGLRVYDFTLEFHWQREGETVLTVTAPEEISGLTARIAEGEARLEFDDVSLGTGALTEEGLTPLELLPQLMGHIDGGYMAECVFETLDTSNTLRILFRDPEEAAGTGMECVVWFDQASHMLRRAELSWEGELVLSGAFTDFYLETDDDHGEEQGADLG